MAATTVFGWPRLASARRVEPIGSLRELSGFVGRQQELAALASDLLDGAGLITLTGVGGVGKTRLAYRVAARVESNYSGGVRAVTLAQLDESGDVATTALAALGISKRPHTSATDSLVHALRDAHSLLVLDNCEHLVEASAELAEELLLRCPGISILATSRESLGVPGERVFRVQPFSPPAFDEPYATLVHRDAVQLFTKRAQTADPSFELTSASGASVARICRLLDGIPLAIELAAARTTGMSVAEISDRLSDPTALLTIAPRTAPLRQQTLRATIDWSYGLLTSQERVLLRRMAVFKGGCTLEAATAVCADREMPAARVVDVLDRLVSKSLVTAVRDHHATRFTLLETVRRYLLARLTEAGETTVVLERHRDWCLATACHTRPDLFDAQQTERVAREQDNLLAALDWTLESDQPASASRLAVGLAPVWRARGRFGEGRSRLLAAVNLPSASSCPCETSIACSWAAILASDEGAYQVAEGLAGRAVRLAELAGDGFALALALCELGTAALGRGELAAAAERFEAALGAGDHGEHLGIILRFRLGEILIEQGNRTRADELLRQATQRTRAMNYRFLEGRILVARARAAEGDGDHALADRLLAEATDGERSTGDVPGLIEALTASGSIHSDRGERARAADALAEALSTATSHNFQLRIAHVLEAICGLLAAGHPGACVRVAAAAHDLRDALRTLPGAGERRRLAAYLEEARRRLGESSYATVWKGAAAVPLETIVEEAHAILAQYGAGRPSVSASVPAPTASDVLTEREREVAMLVMRGLSNRDIAEALVVTRKTAEAHIGHILSKLGLTNRVQIATWSYERGLVPTEADAK